MNPTDTAADDFDAWGYPEEVYLQMNQCPICEAEDTRKLLDWSPYSIHRCRSCRLLFSTPLPSDEQLDAFYQDFMYQKPEKNEIRKQIKKRKSELKRLFHLPDRSPALLKKKFLDYGGGTGIVFNAVSEMGLDAYYHDIDREAMRFTVENFGLRRENIITALEECELKFDYIFSDNVIEHSKNPVDFVQVLLNHLEEGGTIIIKTPRGGNTESLFNPFIIIKEYLLRAMKYNAFTTSLRACLSRFWHCDPPRHLYSFSPNSLRHVMNQLKNSDLEFAISTYTLPWFANTVTKQFFKKDRRFKGMRSWWIRLVTFPVLPLEAILQMTKTLLLKIGTLTPGGLILRIQTASHLH